MRELTVAFNGLLQDKRVRAEQSKYESFQRQRGTVISKYKRAYQEFLDLEAGLQGAKTWYTEMKETVESLEKNVETFVNNRRSEGAQLLNQIEGERAANKGAQAALEQERLRGLMERMSVEPPPLSPRPTPSSRPTPTPLSFTTTPLYPKTNYAGHYQLPSSPPPTQTTAPPSYLPQQPPNQPSTSAPSAQAPPPHLQHKPLSASRPPRATAPTATRPACRRPSNNSSPSSSIRRAMSRRTLCRRRRRRARRLWGRSRLCTMRGGSIIRGIRTVGGPDRRWGGALGRASRASRGRIRGRG